MFPLKKEKGPLNMTFEATLIHLLYYFSGFCRFEDHKQVAEVDKTSNFPQWIKFPGNFLKRASRNAPRLFSAPCGLSALIHAHASWSDSHYSNAPCSSRSVFCWASCTSFHTCRGKDRWRPRAATCAAAAYAAVCNCRVWHLNCGPGASADSHLL